MKKMIKMISFLLTIVMLAIPFPVYATDTEAEVITDINQGGISQTLQTMNETAPLDTYPVIIWLKDIDTTQAVAAATSKIQNFETRSSYLATTARMTRAESEEYNRYIDVKRDAMRSCYESYTTNFANSYLHATETIYCSKYLPFITAELSYARIKALASCPEVEAIGYDAEDEWEEAESLDEYALVRSTTTTYYSIEDMIEYLGIDHMWELDDKGDGVKIGVLDAGIPDVDDPVFSEVADNIIIHDSDIDEYYHATRVLNIISSIAPEATFYCTSHIGDYSKYDKEEAMEWLINNSVHVINISASFGGGEAHSVYSQGDRLLDKYVSTYGITIIKTSGNDKNEMPGTAAAEESAGVNGGALSYNSIVVGNYSQGEEKLSYDSSFYSGSTYAYKPDLCAPGYFAFTIPHADTGNYNGHGTSYSAPLVTGVIAIIMTFRGHLREQPATNKAILTAGVSLDAHHYVPSNFDFRKYGAGILDPLKVYNLALDLTYLNGSLSSSSSEYSYSTSLLAGRTVRISLAFLKKVTATTEYDISDLDLLIYDSSNVLVASSPSLRSNVEVVEFQPTTSGNYTIKVRNIESETSTLFSLAWRQN